MNLPEDAEQHSDASDESDDNAQHQDNSPSSAKKVRSSRACIACRRMKTRCEVDEALGNACKLCIRARRQCVMQSVPRRRKRKTTERVADLEKKIEHLTTLLSATETGSNNATPKSGWEGSGPTIKGSGSEPDPIQPETLVDQAINRGLLDWQIISAAFDRYKFQMCQFSPFVAFADDTDPVSVKAQQPLLFFAIITAATNSMHASPRSELGDMLVMDLALRIMYRGERSLEIIQTLLVQISFYFRAKHMRELNFNQMVHIASTMALDIGLGRRSHRSLSAQPPGQHHLESLASRRAWLGCYYHASSVTISLRHPAFVRWSIYTEECLEVISSDPAALPNDNWLCDVVRIQHIDEDASVVFSMDDPGSMITFQDVKVQYQIGSFSQQLKNWRRNAASDISKPHARHVEAVATLFIHEIALHSEHNIDELRSPLRSTLNAAAVDDLTASLGDLNLVPARIESLFKCLAAIHAVFDSFLSMDLGTLCTLPNLFFVRTGYAARALRKLLIMCEKQTQAGGQFPIDSKTLKFEEYLTSLVDLFNKVHAANNSQVARAFSMVLLQMKAQAMKSTSVPAQTSLPKDPTTLNPKSATAAINLHSQINEVLMPPNMDSRNVSTHPIYPEGNLSYYTTGNANEVLPAHQTFESQLDFGSQPQGSSWYQNETSDSYMTGIDVLQWFGEDFMFDGVSTFGYDDASFPIGTEQRWQQQ